jgi:AraC-like DNA-binding protein
MYREFAVTGALARYIECVWELVPDGSKKSASIKRVFPDGASDIVITPGEGITAHGPANTYRLIPGDKPILGFRIRTGAALAVLGVSVAELRARPVSIRMLFGCHGSEIEERLSAQSIPAMLAAELQRSLAWRLTADSNLDDVVLAAVERLRRSPNIPVRRLASEAALCERQLRRRFKSSVGVSIKQYCRIARFQNLLDAVRLHRRRCGAVTPGWAELAAEYNYADQAHLIREVRAFAGITPTELLHNL